MVSGFEEKIARQLHNDPISILVGMPERLGKQWLEHDTVLRQPIKSSIILDFGKTTHIDSAGASYVFLLQKLCAKDGNRLIIRNIRREILTTLESWGTSVAKPYRARSVESASFFESIGSKAAILGGQLFHALSVLTEMIYWGSLGLLKKRDFPKGALGEQMYQLGYKAIGIVALL